MDYDYKRIHNYIMNFPDDGFVHNLRSDRLEDYNGIRLDLLLHTHL